MASADTWLGGRERGGDDLNNSILKMRGGKSGPM